jgi:hypothetical protein
MAKKYKDKKIEAKKIENDRNKFRELFKKKKKV